MIIGISGKIGSGKDTLAALVKQIDSSYEQKSFAYKLKKITALLCGVSFDLTLTQEGKNTLVPAFNMTVGEMLQKIGTEAMRNGLDKDVWIKALFTDYTERPAYYSLVENKKITSAQYFSFIDEHRGTLVEERQELPNWIITDVRFRNEADYVRQFGGILVRLEGDPAGARAASNRDMTHASETELDNYDKFDIVYHNTGTLEDLSKFAEQLCKVKKEVGSKPVQTQALGS